MKLLYVIAAILALTAAEEEKKDSRGIKKFVDSEAQASLHSKREVASRSYVPSNQGQQEWWENPIPPVNNWLQTVQPEVQNDYYWAAPTPAPYLNEIYWGENGDYKYEYKAPNGIHASEQGWYSDPKKTDESLVKKGWYSYLGPDGKTYTVTYYADHTGYHAFGSHLPNANPPIQTTTQGPIYTVKPIYPSYTYTPKPTYPLYQNQRSTYDDAKIYYPNYNAN